MKIDCYHAFNPFWGWDRSDDPMEFLGPQAGISPVTSEYVEFYYGDIHYGDRYADDPSTLPIWSDSK